MGHPRRSPRSDPYSADNQKKQLLHLNYDIVDPAADLQAAQAQAAELRALHSVVLNGVVNCRIKDTPDRGIPSPAPSGASKSSPLNRSHDYPVFKLSREFQLDVDHSTTLSINQGMANETGSLLRSSTSETFSEARLRAERMTYVLDNGNRRSFKPGRNRVSGFSADSGPIDTNGTPLSDHKYNESHSRRAIKASNDRKVSRSSSDLEVMWEDYDHQLDLKLQSYSRHGALQKIKDKPAAANYHGEEINRAAADKRIGAPDSNASVNCGTSRRRYTHIKPTVSKYNNSKGDNPAAAALTFPLIDNDMGISPANHAGKTAADKQAYVNKAGVNPIIAWFSSRIQPRNTKSSTSAAAASPHPLTDSGPLQNSNNGQYSYGRSRGKSSVNVDGKLCSHDRSSLTMTRNGAESGQMVAPQSVPAVEEPNSKQEEATSAMEEMKAAMASIAQKLQSVERNCAHLQRKMSEMRAQQLESDHDMMQELLMRSALPDDHDHDPSSALQLLTNGGTCRSSAEGRRHGSQLMGTRFSRSTYSQGSAKPDKQLVSENLEERDQEIRSIRDSSVPHAEDVDPVLPTKHHDRAQQHRRLGTGSSTTGNSSPSLTRSGGRDAVLERRIGSSKDRRLGSITGHGDGIRNVNESSELELQQGLQEQQGAEIEFQSNYSGKIKLAPSPAAAAAAAGSSLIKDDEYGHDNIAFDENYKEEFIRAVAETRVAVKQLSRVFVEELQESEAMMEAMELRAADDQLMMMGRGETENDDEVEVVVDEFEGNEMAMEGSLASASVINNNHRPTKTSSCGSPVLRAILVRKLLPMNAGAGEPADLWHVEAAIHSALHEHFENVGFRKNGSHPLPEPRARATNFRRSARRLSRNTCHDLLSRRSPRYDPPFHSFCARKGVAVGRALGCPSTKWTPEVARCLAAAARAVLFLHHLSFAAPIPPSIFRLPPGAPVDRRFMDVIDACHVSTSHVNHVEVMVMPGFILGRNVVKAKVLTT